MIARVGSCLAFAVMWGCYSPAYVDCEVTCATGMGCPAGLTCDTTMNACRRPDMIGRACGAVGGDGGSPDAPVIDAELCTTWPGIFPASNFDPCGSTFPPQEKAPLDIVSGPIVTFDTDGETVMVGSGIAMHVGDTYQGMWAIRYPSVTIEGLIEIVGSKPLLIVADGPIMLMGSGTIDATMATPPEDTECVAPVVTATATGGAGGGGGGYGGAGGNGGAETGGTGALGEGANGLATLVPLRAGCRGGAGGSPVGITGGAGGAAGAAFELVSSMSITSESGTNLEAGGGAGGGGNASLSTCAGAACSGGGGGGGTGGSVLLEAPTLSLQGAICAPGGGGGQGGKTSVGVAGSGGGHGLCAGGAGGDNGDMTGPGGKGADTASAGAGSTGDSAGGGGGGVGRIHLHALPGQSSTGVMIVPAAQ